MVDKKEKIDFGFSSYIFGILSIVLAFFTPLLGFVLGIVGLIQSIKQKTRISNLAKRLNIIGIFVSIVLFAVTLFFIMKSGGTLNLPTFPSK